MRAQPFVSDRCDEDSDRDQQNLDRGRERETKARTVIENLAEKRRRCVRLILSVRDQPPEAHIAQLAKRHINQRQKRQRDKQETGDGYLDLHTEVSGQWSV